VIVPIQAEPYALQGLQDLVPMLDKLTATAQLHKIVVNMYRSNTQLHQNILKEIAEAFPGRLAKQTVRQTIQLAEAARAGLSIFEYAPASIGALDLYALCFELFELSPETVKAQVAARTAAAPAPAAEGMGALAEPPLIEESPAA
jgi:cellulose biosynthesis protein BcsQ